MPDTMRPPIDASAIDVEEPTASRSLLDDIEALYHDARTYLDAELSYQKTRASFVADRVKTTIVFGVVAGFLAILATIGLTVGLIIALTPLVTAWGATAIVVGVLLLLAYLMVRKASSAWSNMTAVMAEDGQADDGADDGVDGEDRND